ncbi:MAG: rhodanese-like domain-containing protein [Candidatus Sabulitectum sp.]|nr:rhodanese-like domain-containing protein [Candidatus Sabulitectum sp.]
MKILLIIIPLVLILIKMLTSRPDINGDEARKLMKNGGKVIDVRSQPEYRNGHIKNSINIPLADILNGVREQGIIEGTPIILYCASGARSASAKRFLVKEGYTNVYNGGSLNHLSKL